MLKPFHCRSDGKFMELNQDFTFVGQPQRETEFKGCAQRFKMVIFPCLETGDGKVVSGCASAERGKSAFYFEILSVM